jgi:hypothetical protein
MIFYPIGHTGVLHDLQTGTQRQLLGHVTQDEEILLI